jgi:transcriptional regulator with XRE-family HTH domain
MAATTDNILDRFGAIVRKKRTALGFSQEDLAAAAGLDRTYIGGVERGKRNISLLNIKKIADALEVRLRDLF